MWKPQFQANQSNKEALAYIKEFDITYINGPDLGTRISQAYNINGVPETFYVDKNGKLLHPASIFGLWLVSFVFLDVLVEYGKGIRAMMVRKGEDPLTAFVKLVSRRRWWLYHPPGYHRRCIF